MNSTVYYIYIIICSQFDTMDITALVIHQIIGNNNYLKKKKDARRSTNIIFFYEQYFTEIT